MQKLHLILLYLLITSGLLACTEEENGRSTPAKTFAITPTEFNFKSEGGNSIINITTPNNWTIPETAAWFTVSKESGTKDSKVTLSISVNETIESRNFIFTVNSGESSAEVTIIQAGASPATTGIAYAIPPDSSNMSALSAVEFANQMTIGWNLGNSLEAIGGETAWGNPIVTKKLIDSVKAAGFDAVRIPVAWSKFSNEGEFAIDEAWMNRVEEVVNYVLDNDMYAIMNIHWDGGWMQPTYEDQDYVNNRLAIMWEQIATNFRDYGDKLLFAGTNEVMVEGDYGTPTEEYYTVQNSFNQTFVNTVRSTGGKNVFRYLVVQGFNTNIDHTANFAEIPEDVRDTRLMMEVHYYDPYNFTLNRDSDISKWGNEVEDPSKVDTWGNEAHVDAQMEKMKTNFIDQGVAVIMGEYGAIFKEAENHDFYLQKYLNYVTEAAAEVGIIPFYWDNGDQAIGGFALFHHETGAVLKEEIVEGIVDSAQ